MTGRAAPESGSADLSTTGALCRGGARPRPRSTMLSRGTRPTSARPGPKTKTYSSVFEVNGRVCVSVPAKMAAFAMYVVDRSTDSLVSCALE